MTVAEQALRGGNNDHYAISIRQEAVRLAESGLSQQAVRQQLGVGAGLAQQGFERLGLALTDAGYDGQPLAKWTRTHCNWRLGNRVRYDGL